MILLAPVLDDLVRPEALLALLAVHQRVGEAPHVAAGHPNLGVHEDGGVQAHVIGVLLDKLFPPRPFDVVLQLRAQGTVVPGVGQSAVDLAAGEDEAPALAQGHNFFHSLFAVFHACTLLFLIGRAAVGGGPYMARRQKRPEPNWLRANKTVRGST